jgi:hypothetical protein
VTVYANDTPVAEADGVTYATNQPITSNEADLGDSLKTPDPIAVVYGQLVVAVVQLTINGFITANSTYVVMQTDMGDGVWADVAWIFWNQVQGSATFVMFGGGLGTGANAFQQTRNAGSVPNPQANGSNAFPLAGRIRFVGQTKMTGGSSSAPGVTTMVTATIRYKLVTPR